MLPTSILKKPSKSFLLNYFSTLTHYDLLEVSQDSNFLTIRKKYLQKIKIIHPDSQSGNHKKFIQLQKAFQILNDPFKRKIYDKSIGIDNPSWNLSEFHSTKQQFQNSQFQKILSDQVAKGHFSHRTSQDIHTQYRQQLYKLNGKKYFFATLLFPISAFLLFWLFWETGETVFFNYKGNTKYQDKQSNVGKDFSVFAAQIR